MYEIGRIGGLRKRLGLTQKELATMAGVSQSLIAKIESGKLDPAYSKVMQIMAVLEREQNKGKKTAEEIMTPKMLTVSPDDLLEKAIALMQGNDVSQLPVFESGKCVGSLSDTLIVELVATKGLHLKGMKVREAMRESFPVIPANSLVDVVADMLRHYRAVLVEKNGKISGIITKADLLNAI